MYEWQITLINKEDDITNDKNDVTDRTTKYGLGQRNSLKLKKTCKLFIPPANKLKVSILFDSNFMHTCTNSWLAWFYKFKASGFFSVKLQFLHFYKIKVMMWKVSEFRVFLVCIFPHSNWIPWDTLYLSVFSPNVGKYGPEKLRIRTFFTQWVTIKKLKF